VSQVDLSFSEERKMLRKSARDFLFDKCPKKLVREMEKDKKGYSPQLWEEMADLGWMGIVFPEKFGGNDMTFEDLSVLLEEMGRACLPGPYFSTVILGGLTILDVGNEEQKLEFLPRIASGKLILTLALTEPNAGYDSSSIKVEAAQDGSDYVIDGTKLFVPDAHVADYILCAAKTGEGANAENGISIFLVDARSPGIICSVLKTISHNKLCEVIFNQVRVPKENILGELNKGWNEVRKIIERAAVAKCCEMMGGMQAVMEMTVEYAKQRVQFEAPIGSFQAIQNHCANILVDVDSSKVITYEAVWRLSKGLDYAKEAAMAKTWVSEAYRRIVITATQVHGGVGIMEDYDMQLYLKRAKSAELAFGDARFHRKTLASKLDLRQGESNPSG
jgi:3-oxocholest-4-en-26-oyl-CoA dehydrogenase beta subunit